jgi:RNA recognition motif-containing protein
MNIFAGNLSYSTTDDSLRAAFEAYGEVSSARVISDRESGRSRGFGFIEMPDAAEGQAAIQALDGQDLDGRAVKVNEARPKEEGGRGGRDSRGGGSRRY